jgi:hypothetical protein
MAVFVCVLIGVQAWQVGRKTKRNFNCFAQAIKITSGTVPESHRQEEQFR